MFFLLCCGGGSDDDDGRCLSSDIHNIYTHTPQTFQRILQRLEEYFDVEILATRLNFYQVYRLYIDAVYGCF